jgi:hypothetical protein
MFDKINRITYLFQNSFYFLDAQSSMKPFLCVENLKISGLNISKAAIVRNKH